MTVVDELPGDMRYVQDSATPGATWDPAARSLTWQIARLPFSGTTLRFLVEPTQLGHRQTNTQARSQYIDGLSSTGELRFPIPAVDVLDREPTPTPTFTPFPTPTPRPTATAMPPEPLYLPLLVWQQCRGKAVHADVALVMDVSSSMSLAAAPGGATKLKMAIDAARIFVGMLAFPGDQAAVISFDSAAELRQPLTGDLTAILAALDRLDPGQGTRIDLGLQRASDELASERAVAANNHVVVVLTDGQNTGAPDSTVRERAERGQGQGIVIYTVGLGGDVDSIASRARSPRPGLRVPCTVGGQLPRSTAISPIRSPARISTWP